MMRRSAIIEISESWRVESVAALMDSGIKLESIVSRNGDTISFIVSGAGLPEICSERVEVIYYISPEITTERYGSQRIVKVSRINVLKAAWMRGGI